MSANEIKPVAWTIDEQLGKVNSGLIGFIAPKEKIIPAADVPLYDQRAIDRLKAERDAAVAERVSDSRKVSNVGKILAGVGGTDPLGCSPASYLLKLAAEMADAARSEGGA